MDSEYSVEMVGISKSFGGVHALKDVTVRIQKGEIHSLVGENGAGKSTLIKILSGAYFHDSGEIVVNGEKVRPQNTADMKKRGIGVIYQEFALAQDCTVAENIFLNKLSKKGGIVNWKQLYKDTRELVKKVGFDIDPKATAGSLSVAYQQIVEITKALSEDVNILILDEPTAVLSPFETERLFNVIKNLKENGVSIIYISHRLDEVMELSDQITVLRDGQTRSTFTRGNVTSDELITEMIGRSPDTVYPERADVQLGEEVLRVQGLNRGNKVIDVSFAVREREILGIAGLVGGGKTESVRLVYGADRLESGEIFVHGNKVKIRSPRDGVKNGIGYLSENRKEQGVLLNMKIKENITLPQLKKVTKGPGVIDRKKEEKASLEYGEMLNIKMSGIEAEVNSLSGGNQQKVSLAKCLFADSKIVILDEPTRGVDIGAKIEIYQIINMLTEKGYAVIMVSSEIEEIIGMCDKVVVMGKGSVRGVLNRQDLNKDRILALSAGVDVKTGAAAQ